VFLWSPRGPLTGQIGKEFRPHAANLKLIMKRARFLPLTTFVPCLLLSLAATTRDVGSSDASPLLLEGNGFVVADLSNGAAAFGNRAYTWHSLPTPLAGWKFTQLRGGETAQLNVRPQRDGFVYVATAATEKPNGFQQVDNLKLEYGQGHTPLTVYRAPCLANRSLAIPQMGWTGTLVLAPELRTATPALPDPTLTGSRPPGVILDYLPPAGKQFIGSPAIVILPDGAYVAAHDIFGKGPKVNHTRVFRSTDRGKTWQQTVEMSGQFFSTLFVHRGALYLLGVSRSGGAIVIRRSGDGGVTWTIPGDKQTGILSGGGNHTAPTPVVEWQGRLWRAMEWNPPKVYEHFQASLISAPVDADLLQAASWTRTNLVRAAPPDKSDAHYWLEGNPVVAPNGQLVDILRIWKDGSEKAALLRLSPDGSTLTWDRARDVIAMPGGGVKFTIRYDSVSRRYWTLTNKQRNPDSVRNVLALISSQDLRNWQVSATLLRHPDRAKHAFQYIDWQFDGEDIVAVSRTSWDGDTFHNANYLTFHRICRFRDASRAIE
jgi:hypothetical protein